ncbi:MAG: retropepsin-like aspartic protease [Thermoanaerobaculia bacterium]
MPSFSFTSSDLIAAGPALQVSIGPSRELINILSPLGTRLAAPHPVTACIDTGAHTTVISPETVRQLGIQPVGTVQIKTPGPPQPLICRRFHVNMYFPEDYVVENLFVIEASMSGLPYQCLIGRDVLKLGVLLYAGKTNQFTLTF